MTPVTKTVPIRAGVGRRVEDGWRNGTPVLRQREMEKVRIMRWARHFSLLDRTLLTVVFLCLLFVPAMGTAVVDTPGPFTFENADIQTVVKQVATLTGIAFLFDPDQVKGRITLLAPPNVSAAKALELLRSALALHGYTLLPRTEGMWIVPAERVVDEAFTIRVVPLTYAWAGEVASTLSWVAPPSVRIVPYYPTNSLVISGHPAAVESLIDLIR